MLELPELDTHPDAYSMLSQGDFGVQRTTSHGFLQLPVDQTMEQTLNRNTKTKGGIIGFSLKKGAVQRWMLTAHARASFVDRCREMASSHPQDEIKGHKELGAVRKRRDEEDVQKVMEVISQWRNPFETADDLVSLSSGSIASSALKEDLLKAEEKGKSALVSFVQDWLTSSTVRFFKTLPRLKLGKFGEVKKTVNQGEKSFVLRADRNLFARLLVIGQNQQIDLRDLLIHELGPVPWSLATYDCSLAKTNKSTPAKLLEDGVEILPNLQNASAVMALLQTLPRIPDCFIDLADLILSAVIKQAGEARRIDFVADQYPSVSIKNIEREKRGRSGQLAVQIRSPQQLCPRQWKKFLANGLNKTNLMEFLADVWGTDQRFAKKIGERTLFVTHGESCSKISVDAQGSISSSIVLELCSNQEEADTRMFLHALHASDAAHQQILIKSSDTDVEVLACYFREYISADIFLLSGTKSRARVINVTQVCEQLGVEVCRALPGLQALTGCDTVSSFAGKGKEGSS